jgi:hypothetical protein
VWLAEDVLTRIMQPKPEMEEPKYKVGRTTNTITSQYEQVYQMEMAKYKSEIAKQRQKEHEYAMRNTKPFANFI